MVNSVPGNGLKLGWRADAEGVQLFHVAVFVAGEARGGNGPIANSAFFVRAFGAQLKRPERPGGEAVSVRAGAGA